MGATRRKLDARRASYSEGNVEPPHLPESARATPSARAGTGGLSLRCRSATSTSARSPSPMKMASKNGARLGVERAWPAAEDERIALAALGGAQRDTA